tara:strand:- start:12115 stop:13353 length:1239 start_codon:yes stop_codon:yes gene_type:complete
MEVLKSEKIKLESFYSFLLLIIFIINPLFGLVFLSFYLVLSDKNNSSLVKLTPFLVALFIGCVNSTKVPENDLIWYLSEYLKAGNMSFLKYIASFGVLGNTIGVLSNSKEIVFAIFNYVIYQILGDNTKLYVLLYSFIAYSFLNLAIYKFGKAIKIPIKFIITAIFIMSFTPYIFTMSAILLRQFLAASLLMYILVNKLCYNKKSYFLILCMVLIHSSAFLFVPFLFIPFFKKTLLNKKTILYYFLIVLVLFNVQNIALILLPLFDNIPMFRYILTRASQDTTFDLGQLSIAKIITSILTVFLPLILIYYLRPRLKKENGLIHFFNVLLVLVIFILANLHQSELSNRLNFYVWQFFPFVFLLYIWYFKLHRLILINIEILIISFFIYYLSTGTWTYTLEEGVYYYSLLNYLI